MPEQIAVPENARSVPLDAIASHVQSEPQAQPVASHLTLNAVPVPQGAQSHKLVPEGARSVPVGVSGLSGPAPPPQSEETEDRADDFIGRAGKSAYASTLQPLAEQGNAELDAIKDQWHSGDRIGAVGRSMNLPIWAVAKLVRGLGEAHAQEFQRAYDLASNGHDWKDVIEAGGHAVAGLVPGLGPWVSGTTEKASKEIGAGKYAEAVGTVGANVALAAAPKLFRGGEAAVEAGKGLPEASRAVEGAAESHLLKEPEFSGNPEHFVHKDYLPEDSGLYHVTTAKDKVLAEGLKPRSQTKSVGLGGGFTNQGPDKISVTFDEAHANVIAERLRLASEASRDKISPREALDRMIQDGNIPDDIPEPVASALGAPEAVYEDWEEFDKWFDENYKHGDAYSVVQDLDDALSHIYSDSETHSGRVGLTASKKQMALIDPAQIDILKVEGKRGSNPTHIPDEMELRFHPDDIRIKKEPVEGETESHLTKPIRETGITWETDLPADREFPGREPGSRLSETQRVPIEQIQTTEKFNEEQVQKLVQQMKSDPSAVPPIVVEFSEDGARGEDILATVDGHNRLEAARRLGIEEVPVQVHVLPEDFAKVEAAGGMNVERPKIEPLKPEGDEAPRGYIRIYRGINPERNQIAGKDPTHGYWYTTTYEDAVNYANWDYEGTGELGPDRAILAVDVPEHEAFRFAQSGSRRKIRDVSELHNPDAPVEMHVDDATARSAEIVEGDKEIGLAGQPEHIQEELSSAKPVREMTADQVSALTPKEFKKLFPEAKVSQQEFVMARERAEAEKISSMMEREDQPIVKIGDEYFDRSGKPLKIKAPEESHLAGKLGDAYSQYERQFSDSSTDTWNIGGAEIRKVSAIPDFVETRNLPKGRAVRAWTQVGSEGPIIYIKSGLTPEQFQEALQHELEHVSKKDYPTFKEEYPELAGKPEFPGLVEEARKAKTFEEFKHDFSHQTKHGRYYHLTSDPNFFIDPEKGPRDLSSMAEGIPETGKLMITSDLENWAAHYGKSRPYVAVIDMSDVPREAYKQVKRGYGNEFFVDDPSAAKVEKVIRLKAALRDSKDYWSRLEKAIGSDEDLESFYNAAKEKSHLGAGELSDLAKRAPTISGMAEQAGLAPEELINQLSERPEVVTQSAAMLHRLLDSKESLGQFLESPRASSVLLKELSSFERGTWERMHEISSLKVLTKHMNEKVLPILDNARMSRPEFDAAAAHEIGHAAMLSNPDLGFGNMALQKISLRHKMVTLDDPRLAKAGTPFVSAGHVSHSLPNDLTLEQGARARIALALSGKAAQEALGHTAARDSLLADLSDVREQIDGLTKRGWSEERTSALLKEVSSGVSEYFNRSGMADTITRMITHLRERGGEMNGSEFRRLLGKVSDEKAPISPSTSFDEVNNQLAHSDDLGITGSPYVHVEEGKERIVTKSYPLPWSQVAAMAALVKSDNKLGKK